jgi:SOS-response transcriptional repressor LexA
MPMIDRCAEAVYSYIRNHWNAHGQAPTRDEIQRGTGLSPMQIDRRIIALEAGGYITRRLGRKRTIQTTSKPLPAAGAGQ